MFISSLATKIVSSASTSRSGGAAFLRRSFHATSSCWEKLNVKGLANKVDLNGKNVLVRVDLNVPLAKVRGRVCGPSSLIIRLRVLLGYTKINSRYDDYILTSRFLLPSFDSI